MAHLREGCLWEQVTPQRPVSPALFGECSADVCIIGAGFTGLSAALQLLEGGKSVCVVEAHQVGHGGSGRNVGLVNAGTWVAPDELEKTLGAVEATRLNTALGAAPALVFATIDKYNIDCQDTRTGNLHMAHNAKGLADLRSRAEQWQRRGANVELLTGKPCEDACGTDKAAGALLDHRAGTVNPMAYVSGMALNVVARGGQLFGCSSVTGLQRTSDGWKVSTAAGSVRAEKVIIASNAYTEGEWTDIKDHIFAGYYYQVASQPLSGAEQAEVLRGGQGSWDTRTVLSSIRRDAQGRLVLGSLGNAGNYPLWFIRRWADRIQQHYFPQLGKVEWESTWTGRIGFTPDHLLRLFEPAPGLLAATGFNGRGVTTGTLVGKCFADYLLSNDAQALPVSFSSGGKVSGSSIRTLAYDAGFTLYHAGQCLRVVL
ncbi:FAD-binding oxidoreductase [Pseudomonas viridiflava]|uniref:L-pipecolate oxidase n=1 Tax=Pseudomonas viridiflava TaxID=33069 RepID=UPI002EC63F9D|nr:FAD-binding oxidoreductase [Pseudomonas viridiflava]